MKKLRFLLSLTTKDNDYQAQQARSAEAAARACGADLDTIYADNDSITQSTQILKVIQGPQPSRPDAVIFEPVSNTALPHVARATAAAGIGWVVLNSEPAYIGELRRQYPLPIFVLTSDHVDIGRLQGRQLEALLPNGGSALYIQGPGENSAAKERTRGMQETKPANVQVIMLKAQFTEESSQRAVRSWLKLPTSGKAAISVVCAQDDSMAIGARKAFEEVSDIEQRQRWLSMAFTGCDGLPKTGQTWVRTGILSATIFVPPNAGRAIEILAGAANSKTVPPEKELVKVVPIPPLAQIPAHNPR